jgi:hypothetical protein
MYDYKNIESHLEKAKTNFIKDIMRKRHISL